MNVLIADDDAVSRHLLAARLRKWGYSVVAACDGNEAWEHLNMDASPKLAILDWMMPGLDGVEICRRLRQRTDTPYVYTILLTTKGRMEELVEGMGAGADDYLIKPVNVYELEVRLRAGSRIIKLQEELIAARERLWVKATHDPLTALWDRQAIFEIMERELARCQQQGSNLSIIMADVDHFKQINDSHGHQAGDAVLRNISRRILEATRPYDDIGRYGGEEFLIVLPGCDIASAGKVAERIRAMVAAEPCPLPEGDETITVTMSLGIASGNGDNLHGGGEAMVRAADFALYRAKANGRNRTESTGG